MADPTRPVGAWSTGLCDCCAGESGCLTCLLAAFVPCAQHGINAEKLQQGEALCTGDFFCGCISWCGLYYLGVPCIIQMSTRSAIRKKYNIPGSDFKDCCISCWCGACDLCQQHYQLTGPHNRVPVSTDPNVAATGIPVQSKMVDPPVAYNTAGYNPAYPTAAPPSAPAGAYPPPGGYPGYPAVAK